MSTPIASTYLVNNIPRGTSAKDLICSLAEHWKPYNTSVTNYPLLVQMMEREPVIHDSQLDDGLSVAVLEFKLASTPKWFQILERDPKGFPKECVLGTLWRGVDLTACDEDGRTAFCSAVISGNVLLAETLAEFPQTVVNVQDRDGRTPLHWACVERHLDMTAFLLTVPGLDSGVRDVNGLTAFDISCENTGPDPTDAAAADRHDALPTMFYKSILEMEESDPDGALLRMLKVSSDPDEGPVFPGEALFRPAVANNLPLVEALMESGVDLTATTEDQETALHLAAKKGNVEIVKALLANPSRGKMVNVNSIARDGLTALHYAADGGHQETVQELLSYGADRTAEDDLGLTAFDRAVENQHSVIQQILKPEETEVEVKPGIHDASKQAETPLATLDNGSTSVVQTSELALTGNVDPEIWTLAKAAQTGRIDILRRMLDLEDEIERNSEDSADNRWRNSTLLHTAIWGGHYDAASLLLDRGANTEATCTITYRSDFQTRATTGNWTALHLATNLGNDRMVQLLLERGARIQAPGNNNVTALHLAAGIGHQQIIESLLNHGAVVDAVDSHGRTALSLAANLGQLEAARLLLSRGAALELQLSRERSVLYLAAEGGHTEMVQLLLDRGAAMETVDYEGVTALYAAARYNHPDVIEQLLDRGAAIDTKDNNGFTALHGAISWGRVQVAQLLVNRGAGIDIRDNNGLTALHTAAGRGDYEIVLKLLDSGANILARTDDGKLPIDISKMRPRNPVTQLLLERGGGGDGGSASGLRARTRVSNRITPYHEISAFPHV